jgi:hypothetical protein
MVYLLVFAAGVIVGSVATIVVALLYVANHIHNLPYL